MTSGPNRSHKVELLSEEISSLSRGIPAAPPDTLFVLGATGMRISPDADFPVVFGRNEPDVHICVGADDPHVSRRHGTITREHSCWVLHNLGALPIRLPDMRLLPKDGRTELLPGYTALFIASPRQDHLLEVRIVPKATPVHADTSHESATRGSGVWRLDPDEELVLVCLGQRYLRDEPQPQPLTWRQVAEELAALRPDEPWTKRRAERIVGEVRVRLSSKVPGLVEDEVPPPVGNMLNHNLIMELLATTTLAKWHLSLLGDTSGE